MSDDLDTATSSVWLDRLTFPYWWLMEQWQLLRFDRHIGITGPWWGRQAKRRAYWQEFARRERHGGVL